MRNDFESNYLAHSAKGTTWKNVKYFKKVMGPSGKYIYFYSQAALDKYMHNQSQGRYARKNPNEIPAEPVNKSSSSKTIQQKKAQTASYISSGKKAAQTPAVGQRAAQIRMAKAGELSAAGKKKADEILAKAKEDTKKKGKGSSSSKKEKDPMAKTGKGSSKSSSGSSKKEKTGSTKAASSKKTTAEKAKTAAQLKSEKQKAIDSTPINLDTLKKIYGAKDEDVTTHDMTAPEFKNKMLSKYDEGSFGYLMAGNKAYKWTIEGGQLIIKDFDTDKNVSFDTYLKDVKQFKEFQTNKKKK